MTLSEAFHGKRLVRSALSQPSSAIHTQSIKTIGNAYIRT